MRKQEVITIDMEKSFLAMNALKDAINLKNEVFNWDFLNSEEEVLLLIEMFKEDIRKIEEKYKQKLDVNIKFK